MTVSFSTDRFEHHAAQNEDCVSDEAVHVQHPLREQFAFTYLPENVRSAFTEALQCYAANLFNAFGLMCRHTACVSIAALEEPPEGQWLAAFEQSVQLGEIDAATSQTIEALLFGEEAAIPSVDAALAAVILEIMKDVLYQRHVRAAKLRAAMKMRRFFAEEHAGKLATLRRPRGSSPGE